MTATMTTSIGNSVRTFLDYPKELYRLTCVRYGLIGEIFLLKTYRGDWAWRFTQDDERLRNWLKVSSYDEASRLAKHEALSELEIRDNCNYGEEF